MRLGIVGRVRKNALEASQGIGMFVERHEGDAVLAPGAEMPRCQPQAARQGNKGLVSLALGDLGNAEVEQRFDDCPDC